MLKKSSMIYKLRKNLLKLPNKVSMSFLAQFTFREMSRMFNRYHGSRIRISKITSALVNLWRKRDTKEQLTSASLDVILRSCQQEISQRLERKESRYQEARRREYHWQEQSMPIETSY
jgi:hypothetical protein